MEEKRTYRLGNQDKEYQLITDYLGWFPEGQSDWEAWIEKHIFEPSDTRKNPELLTLVSPDKKEKVELLMGHALIKDAFPLDFFTEVRAKKWWRFYKVSNKENPAVEFVIPLH